MEVVDLTRALKQSARPLVMTGAGVSVASGIAPFRGRDDAVWENAVLEMGTVQKFRDDPVEQWTWYLKRFAAAATAVPNPAHIALATIERLKRAQGHELRLVTQNVDGLHVAAGSEQVIEIHGAARYVRCSNDYACVRAAPEGTILFERAAFAAFEAAPSAGSLPTCPYCASLLRPHVLWFDEIYSSHLRYQFAEVQGWLADCDLVVFVGTSFSVGITDMAIDAAIGRRVPHLNVNPTGNDNMGNWIQGAAEHVLPAVVEAWGSR